MMPPTDPIKLAEYGGIALSCLALGVNGSYYKNLSVDRGKKTAGYFFMGACAVSGTTILSNTSGIDPNITTGIWLCSQVVRTAMGMIIEQHPDITTIKKLQGLINALSLDSKQEDKQQLQKFYETANTFLGQYWSECLEFSLIAAASCAVLTNNQGVATGVLATSTALSLRRLHLHEVPGFPIHAAQKTLRTLAPIFPPCASLAEIATLGFLVKGRNNS
ncbi:MAG: hypothetical protein ACK59C_01515 [Holosporales bacterium]|jgi:hypothetical protein